MNVLSSFLWFTFQFAGAAQSLGAGAILVNPWNITEVAASIGYALTMPADEREKRHRHNFTHVATHTSQEWAETFVRYVTVVARESVTIKARFCTRMFSFRV